MDSLHHLGEENYIISFLSINNLREIFREIVMNINFIWFSEWMREKIGALLKLFFNFTSLINNQNGNNVIICPSIFSRVHL